MNPTHLLAAGLCALLPLLPALPGRSVLPSTQPPSPMKLHSLTPNVLVEDMDRTLAFYRDVLGFELVTTVPETAPYNWAMARRDDVTIMFQTRASLGEDLPVFKDRPAGGALTFFIRVEGIDDLHAHVRGKAPFVQELTETFYGMREFSIEDGNGFVLTFAEPVK